MPTKGNHRAARACCARRRIYKKLPIAWTKVLDLLTRHGKPSFFGRRLKRKRNFRTARTDVSNNSNHDFRPRALARCRFFQPLAPTRPGIFEQFERFFCEKPWRKAHFRTPTPFGFYNITRHGSRGVHARGLRLPANRLSMRRKPCQPCQPCTGPHAPNGAGPCVRMRDTPCDCTRAAISRVVDFGRTFVHPQ